jgi:aspartate/methionine/tyrosine aminotransferase
MTVTSQPLVSLDTPVFAVPEEALIPVNGYPATQMDIPQSKMFLIKKMLENYRAKFGADALTYDASQGDGGASLPGVPAVLLDRANELHKKRGTGYDQPYGTDAFRKATAEQYWQLDPATGFGPTNITATDGGRDALLKAYQAMITLGTGRIGDALIVSRVPWISYNWGPYGVGLNVLLAPGREESAWQYTDEGLEACIEYCARYGGGRRVAGIIITSPDNPTGRTLPMQRQIELARKAISLGIPFVLFDWIYHQVTSGATADINAVLNAFSPQDRDKLMFLDGLTKSLGASNVRGAHLIASKRVTDFVVSRASHGVSPNFYAQAVAMAAYEMGFRKAAEAINGPTNASREVMRRFLQEKGYNAIMGDGYYAFIDCTAAIRRGGLEDSIAFNAHLAENHGLTTIPGAYFSDAGKNWVRFSYALPPEKTQKAVERFDEAFRSLK